MHAEFLTSDVIAAGGSRALEVVLSMARGEEIKFLQGLKPCDYETLCGTAEAVP
jgi:hypothetical protein